MFWNCVVVISSLPMLAMKHSRHKLIAVVDIPICPVHHINDLLLRQYGIDAHVAIKYALSVLVGTDVAVTVSAVSPAQNWS